MQCTVHECSLARAVLRYYSPVVIRPLARVLSAVLFLLLLACARPLAAYSLLTHEQLIDLTWHDSIVPLLLSRYPNLTPADLENARAYAYAGCVIQDIGYYPFGDQSFSNLTHYVRSGDFVVNLFRNAGDANELAFAVGALSHYIGDNIGHPQATNLAVPIEFPKLARKYGHLVNYAEGQHQHVQTEFAFDIDEIAHDRIAPLGYQRHVGLRVPVRQLALAYYQTYGITEDFGKRGRRFNVGAYRYAVHALIPHVANALALLYRNREPAETQSPDLDAIQKEVAAVSARDNWDHFRRKPGIGTYALAGLLFVLPKVGPLSLVAIKGPTSSTEADYFHSVVQSTLVLRHALARFTPPPPVRSTARPEGATQQEIQQEPRPPTEDLAALEAFFSKFRDPRHPLPNRDLDTGQVVKLGGYPLTDLTYAALLHELTRQPSQPIPPGIKSDIQAYFANPPADVVSHEPPQLWAQVQADLIVLATMPTSNEPEPYPTYGDHLETSK
jgi:hypothetical protein